MLRLIRGPGEDRGAVAAIVAVVVGAFVLTGVAALTIDAGSLYAERRVVQNAADAASLALAHACAVGDTVRCSATAPATLADLTTLANLNSPDGLTDIESVCGSVAPFASCGTLPTDPGLVQCTKLPPLIPVTAKWVEVRTKTRSTTSNHSVVAKSFANLGNSSYDGKGVKACARAAWGPVGPIDITAPLAISLCDYEAMITTTGYADPPPYASPIPASVTAHEIAVVVNDPGQTTDSNNCKRWAGHVLPGGFGYLTTGTQCSLTLKAGDWVQGKPGASVPSECKPFMDDVKGTSVLIPVFDCVSDHTKVCPKGTGGADTWYRVAGLAAFYVTGYNLPSYSSPPLNAATTCPSGKCLYGWFTEATLRDDGTSFWTPDKWFGVNKVKVAG